ncbi:MAG: hypothetical protein QXS41_03300 [Candidatus Woesearchaeota archaeon]
MKSKMRKTLVGVLTATSMLPLFLRSEKPIMKNYVYADIPNKVVQKVDYSQYDEEINRMMWSLSQESDELIYNGQEFSAFRDYFGYPFIKRTGLDYSLVIPVVSIPYSHINEIEMKNFYNFLKFYSELQSYAKNPENPLYDEVSGAYNDFYSDKILAVANNEEFKAMSERYLSEELDSFFGPINTEGFYYIFKTNDFITSKVSNKSLTDILKSIEFVDTFKNSYNVTKENPNFDFFKALFFSKLLNPEYLKEYQFLYENKNEVDDFVNRLGYTSSQINEFYKKNENLKRFIEKYYKGNKEIESIKKIVAVANFELEKHLRNSLTLIAKKDNEFFKYLDRNVENGSNSVLEQYKMAFGNLLRDVAYNDLLAGYGKEDPEFEAFKNTGMYMNLREMYMQFLKSVR